jgi:hypothetical protein
MPMPTRAPERRNLESVRSSFGLASFFSRLDTLG